MSAPIHERGFTLLGTKSSVKFSIPQALSQGTALRLRGGVRPFAAPARPCTDDHKRDEKAGIDKNEDDKNVETDKGTIARQINDADRIGYGKSTHPRRTKIGTKGGRIEE